MMGRAGKPLMKTRELGKKCKARENIGRHCEAFIHGCLLQGYYTELDKWSTSNSS